jgi:hypothetical protein
LYPENHVFELANQLADACHALTHDNAELSEGPHKALIGNIFYRTGYSRGCIISTACCSLISTETNGMVGFAIASGSPQHRQRHSSAASPKPVA